MKKQSLTDTLRFGDKDLAEAKKGLAASNEKKATAEGELTATSKDLAEDKKVLGELHHDCMSRASDFEEETKSRGEELDALAKAKKVIEEATGGAAERTYGLAQVSFLQASASVPIHAVHIVRKLALAQRSAALSQLLSRVESAVRSRQGDVFSKVKGLIADMVSRLEAEAEADATQKAYCDKEMSETKEKREDKEAEIEKLSTKSDQLAAESAKLKEEAATLTGELAKLESEQAQMDKLRQEEHTAYSEARPEMEKGVEGVQMALKVLREYYGSSDKAHEAEDGASTGVIGLLEVAESDFSKGLAEIIADEERALAAYEKETKENAVAKATKETDLKYKTNEAASLDKAIVDLKTDLDGVNEELGAVNDYQKEIDKKCVAKAESYEDRKARREAEITGLQEALAALDGDAFVQLGSRHTVHRHLRAAA